MITPNLADDALLSDIFEAARDADALHLWWLGQSGFLLQWRGWHLLIDPYLSDSLTEKYRLTEKPHERISQRVVAPEHLAFVDVVLSTHNHTDHLDAATLQPILKSQTFVIPEANRSFVADRLKCPPESPIGLDDGVSWRIAAGDGAAERSITVTGIAAAHDQLERDERGRHRYLGYVIDVGGTRIYHSGDTVVYPGLVERLRPYSVDIAILPINGKVGNMGGRDAVRLAHEIGAKWVIPCHYAMFAFNSADPADEFVPECERLGQPYRVLELGERLTWTR